MSQRQRPMTLDDDPWMMFCFIVLIALVSSGLLLWSGALVAVWLSGQGWHGSQGGEAGVFLGELLDGATPAEAWTAASGGASPFAP